MTEHTIPLITVRGSYAEVGAAIGDACAATIERECDTARWHIPPGRSVKDQLALADRYAEVTRPLLPWVFQELDGCAEAVGVDPRALWAACIEEIWYEPRTAGQVGAAIDGRCSDLVAVPPATADGHTLTAHNNDMSRSYQHDLVAIERTCGDDPTILSIGNGIWLSVGWNDAGLNLTGNELSPNDERIGIPREIQVRAMLRERTLEGMTDVALDPARASSYNNVLVYTSGGSPTSRGRQRRRRSPPRTTPATWCTRTTTSAARCVPSRAIPNTRTCPRPDTAAPRSCWRARRPGRSRWTRSTGSSRTTNAHARGPDP